MARKRKETNLSDIPADSAERNAREAGEEQRKKGTPAPDPSVTPAANSGKEQSSRRTVPATVLVMGRAGSVFDPEDATGSWDGEGDEADEEEEEVWRGSGYGFDDDESDADEDDEDEGDDDEDDLNRPPPVVQNDDQELLAFLRTAAKAKFPPPALADWLRDREDPRADVVQELTVLRPALPEDPSRLREAFLLGASPQWGAILKRNRVVACSYSGTLLRGYLRASGVQIVAVRLRRDGQTHEGILAAFERCRLQLVLALFDTTEGDLRAKSGLAVRVGRLMRRLRRGRQVAAVCDEIATDPELAEALMRALAKSKRDRHLWEAVMDRHNPDWRSSVPLKPAT